MTKQTSPRVAVDLEDNSPVNVGHSLVIPKEHYATLLDFPNKIGG